MSVAKCQFLSTIGVYKYEGFKHICAQIVRESYTVKKVNNFLSNMGFMFAYSWRAAKIKYLFAVISIVLDSVQPVFSLIMPKYIIDELTGQRRWETICIYIALLVLVNLAINLIRLFVKYIHSHISYKSYVKFSMDFAYVWANMDYEKLENSEIRDRTGKAAENTHPVRFIDSTVVGFFTNIIQLAGYTYIIATLHPLVLLFVVVCIIISSAVSRKKEKISYDYQPFFVNMSRKFTYLFNSMIRFEFGKEIRINKASKWLEEKYSALIDKNIAVVKENQKKNLWLDLLLNLLSFVQMLVMYGYSAMRVITKAITIGDFSVYISAVALFVSSCSSLVARFASLGFLSKFVDEYKDCIDLTTPTTSKKGVNHIEYKHSAKNEIEFENVSFIYPNTDKYVLKNVNLKISSGEKLAIVGYNGAGKTTFIKLICRLYEPTEGRILYNGIDISTINYTEYRELLSVVFQDFGLFSFSVRDNITLDRPLDEELLWEAIDKSNLMDKIKGLEEGWETPLGKQFHDNGIEFSGGEGQKLACARAYYRKAPIIIFDEPTAALDPLAENQLYNRFNDIIENKTAIYISHRLASVKFCDKVAVFDSGRVVEYGDHDSLMKQNGVYAEMYHKQAQYYN